ncbi:sodium-dependent transporter [Dielma fastidiosa]|uniref:Transporter n=1 Tax=Dielma fastidiosa TaxID=1034346 RepID=A0A318KUF3_9FIRM|nr:sodium-dependent transporter [Dielma fastidiosa]PXX80478.1 NSS family neurotransmitter:Na+ symporter [Dielma fastidiosa]
MKKREKFSSRFGFILISAGCAIGLGNVWRFPYITGKYGGAAFVLLYLFLLLILGLPIMVMEFAVGRASQKSVAGSFEVLEPKGSKWHLYKYFALSGNYLLMMFYTTIAGWMLIYFFKTLAGGFAGLNIEQVAAVYDATTSDPWLSAAAMLFVVALGMFIVSRGLRNGVEKVSKFMMSALLLIMVLLAIRSLTLPNAMAGLAFYLKPDFGKLFEYNLSEVIFAAMGQAFFTLSLGIGALAIFGSYIDKERSLLGESISITLLDTFVALVSGLIIFPACFAFGVNPDSGFGLIFVTLPNIFNNMPLGQLWGGLFFIFLFFAALTTIIAVFENIVSCFTDLFNWSRKKSVLINMIGIMILSMPCLLGFSVWSHIQPLFGGSIMGLEDFLISNNLLPLGSLLYLMFCVSRYGWGWQNFLAEANTGKGLKFPAVFHFYLKWILPLIVLFIFIQGYLPYFK